MALVFKQKRFGRLPTALRKLQRGGLRQAASGAIRDEVEELVDERFEKRADPYGNPWAPRKPPTGTWPLLEKSGAMRKRYHVSATAAGVTVTNSQDYAKYHQTGTSKMVARRALPDGPLPAEWDRRIDAAVTRELKRILGGS